MVFGLSLVYYILQNVGQKSRKFLKMAEKILSVIILPKKATSLKRYLVRSFEFWSFIPQPDESSKCGAIRNPRNKVEVIDKYTEI